MERKRSKVSIEARLKARSKVKGQLRARMPNGRVAVTKFVFDPLKGRPARFVEKGMRDRLSAMRDRSRR